MSTLPKKSPAEFFGTDDLIEQLRVVAKSDGWAIPASYVPELARRAVDALERKRPG